MEYIILYFEFGFRNNIIPNFCLGKGVSHLLMNKTKYLNKENRLILLVYSSNYLPHLNHQHHHPFESRFPIYIGEPFVS